MGPPGLTGPQNLGMRLPLTGAKIPKIGKRGFRSEKTPISHHPRKGAPSQKIPISIQSKKQAKKLTSFLTERYLQKFQAKKNLRSLFLWRISPQMRRCLSRKGAGNGGALSGKSLRLSLARTMQPYLHLLVSPMASGVWLALGELVEVVNAGTSA